MTIYSESTGNQVTVDVTEAPVATELTMVVDLPSVTIGEFFNLSGLLTAADGTILASQTIQLQQEQADGTFADVDVTATTDSTGAYTISISEAAAGTFVYRPFFAGVTI
jgi:hypothetical protein